MLLEFVVFNGNYQVWATSRFLFEFLPGTKIRPYSEINTFQPSLTYEIDAATMASEEVGWAHVGPEAIADCEGMVGL